MPWYVYIFGPPLVIVALLTVGGALAHAYVLRRDKDDGENGTPPNRP